MLWINKPFGSGVACISEPVGNAQRNNRLSFSMTVTSHTESGSHQLTAVADALTAVYAFVCFLQALCWSSKLRCNGSLTDWRH